MPLLVQLLRSFASWIFGPLKRELKLSKAHSICKSLTYIFLFLDDQYIPEWENFFSDTLAQRINDTTFNHESVLKKVVDKFGGPIRRPVQYPDRVALFESDLVEPLVLRGSTDIITVAERQELLNLRAQNANLLRLVGKLRC